MYGDNHVRILSNLLFVDIVISICFICGIIISLLFRIKIMNCPNCTIKMKCQTTDETSNGYRYRLYKCKNGCEGPVRTIEMVCMRVGNSGKLSVWSNNIDCGSLHMNVKLNRKRYKDNRSNHKKKLSSEVLEELTDC